MPASAAVMIVLAAVAGIGSPAGAGDRSGLAIFAADAEAWGFSVEAGVPGPLGPLTSHTTASIDNSPHAVGAAGLADPGLLVRTLGEVTLGIATPAYCESASPEGPPDGNCAAPAVQDGVQVGQAQTRSSDRPEATSTARYGRVNFNEAAALDMTPDACCLIVAVSVKSQSTIADTTATESGVEAYSRVALQGVSLAGGAVRVESLQLARKARAGATEHGSTVSTEVTLSGLSVAGQKVDPGRDAVQALTDAARAAFGDRLQVSSGELVEERTPDGKLRGETSGLVVRWQTSPDRWVRVVLGYARVMAYGVPMVADTVPDAVIEAPVPEGPPGRPLEGLPSVADGVGPREPAAPAPAAPAKVGVAARDAATDLRGAIVRSAGTAPLSRHDLAEQATPAASAAAMPFRRSAVQWVSPFLVLAQMTSGSQARWLVAALVPLLLFRRLWRRADRAPGII